MFPTCLVDKATWGRKETEVEFHDLFKSTLHCRCTTAEKSFAAGSLAECMEPLHGQLEPFVGHVLPIFNKLITDEDDDVRNNAVFGLGELVLHAGEIMYPHFDGLLATLSR